MDAVDRRSVWHFILIVDSSASLLAMCFITFILGSSAIVFANWYLALAFIMALIVLGVLARDAHNMWQLKRSSIVWSIKAKIASLVLSLGILIFVTINDMVFKYFEHFRKLMFIDSKTPDNRYFTLLIVYIIICCIVEIVVIVSAFKVCPKAKIVPFEHEKISKEQV